MYVSSVSLFFIFSAVRLALLSRFEPHVMQFHAKFGNGAAYISGEHHASAVIHTIGLEQL
jgi:hypothetical protein